MYCVLFDRRKSKSSLFVRLCLVIEVLFVLSTPAGVSPQNLIIPLLHEKQIPISYLFYCSDIPTVLLSTHDHGLSIYVLARALKIALSAYVCTSDN